MSPMAVSLREFVPVPGTPGQRDAGCVGPASQALQKGGPEMRVLGIDQAMDNKCGFAVVDDQGVVYTYMETYKGIKHGCTRQRCYRFGAVLQTIYNTYKPDAVVTEMVRAFHQGQVNKHTISALSQLQGVINVVIPQPVPVYIV